MDPEQIKKRLQELRAAGKTQAGLAKALNIDTSNVSRMLAGRREIKARELTTIYAYLDMAPPETSQPNTSAPALAPVPLPSGPADPYVNAVALLDDARRLAEAGDFFQAAEASTAAAAMLRYVAAIRSTSSNPSTASADRDGT